MADMTKGERKVLRGLASQVYEAEARRVLNDLYEAFQRLQMRELESFDLIEQIHRFHHHESRQLWSTYQFLKPDQIVARGVALKLVDAAIVPPVLLGKLSAQMNYYSEDDEFVETIDEEPSDDAEQRPDVHASAASPLRRGRR